ncbi:MAG: hypothetical protein ACKO5K_00085 [Armatimonadota bacterium]
MIRPGMRVAGLALAAMLMGGAGYAFARFQRGVVKPTMADTIRGAVYADNWFAMYVNGKLVAVDPIDFLPHNVVKVDLLPEYPMTIAIIAKDNADPKTGFEYGDKIGDAGIALKFSDGTTTHAGWKVKRIFSGPPVRHEPLPDGWQLPGFDDSGWANATEYTLERVDPKQPYYDADFQGATFVWTDDLDRDNTILLRTTVRKPGWKPRWNTKPDLDTTGIVVKG